MNQEDRIKKQKIRVSIKRITDYHTTKVGIALGANLKYGSPEWYKTQLSKRCTYDDPIFEIKREWIFEKDYKSKCMVVYAILPE